MTDHRPPAPRSGRQIWQQIVPPLWQRWRSLLLFCVSGTLAMAVDIGVLYALKPWLGNYGARVLSVWAAASFTWAFNRHITFAQGRRQGFWREYGSYLASMAVGAAINYAVYAACVRLWPLAAAQPGIAVVLSSLAGLSFNFAAARRIMGPAA